jgi:hypothetical protein
VERVRSVLFTSVNQAHKQIAYVCSVQGFVEQVFLRFRIAFFANHGVYSKGRRSQEGIYPLERLRERVRELRFWGDAFAATRISLMGTYSQAGRSVKLSARIRPGSLICAVA